MVLTDMIEVNMTDYCYNEIIFYGNNSDINDLSDFLGEDNGGFSFQKICPEPVQKDRDWNGYEWRKDNWSTKWDCWEVKRELIVDGISYLHIKFCCPWNPPFKVLDKVCSYFPDIYVTMSDTRENEIYRTSIVVRHPLLGWSNLYVENFSEDHDDKDLKYRHYEKYPCYKGNIFRIVYEEMITVKGFLKSLLLVSFRRDWIEKAIFL
ncbi:MAG: hypothetical protein WCO11_00175 [Sphingomonadales bacterium]|jgi:hypothetical protein